MRALPLTPLARSASPRLFRAGHLQGYAQLMDVLEWCVELGVEIVTVFAFSVDNFKRTPREVDGLMRLAKDKFTEMLSEESRIAQYAVRVQVSQSATAKHERGRDRLGSE